MSATATAPMRPEATSHPEHVPPAVVRPRRRWWATALHSVPNLVVFSLLGGVMYVGHHTGWKLPKLSELRGTGAITVDDWCSEHLVAESECIECHPERMPKAKPFGFCQKHGVAECVIDHPELTQVKGDPQLPKYDTIEAISLMPRSENNSRNTLHTSRIQFSSAESISKAGIDVDVVQERPMIEAITANGELMFDPTHVAHLSARVPGSVALVFKTMGDPVAAGDVLALVDAAQVGQAKSQLLQAVVQLQSRQTTVNRLHPAATSGAIPQKSLIEAEVALQESEVTLISTRQALANLGFELPDGFETRQAQALAEELRFLGLPTTAVGTLPVGTHTANLIPVRTPFDGVVTASQIVAGEVVDTSNALFTVCDPARMWLMLNVRQEDAARVYLGLPVRFRSDDGVHQLEGQIAWISPAVDEHTRTIRVRVTIANSAATLRDKTFGTGQIIQRQEPNAIVVPRDAVQSTADASFVFVRDKYFFDEQAPKFFHVRQIRIGARDDQFVELLAGVLPGEVIATKGSNVLLSQLLRSQLGAGCGCHED